MPNTVLSCKLHLIDAREALATRNYAASYSALRMALAEANRAKLACRGHILRAMGACRRAMA